jgi:Cytochrome P450
MTLNSLILGLLANPRVVLKAQEELDRVVGFSRLPTFEDEKELPYIRAIVKEVKLLAATY